jgi:hypothetical protein
MPRCDAYSRLTNSRCTSEGTRSIVASDHEVYCVCKTHAVKVWTTEVAHWHSDTDLRRTVGPVEVRAANPPVPAFAWAS